MYRLLALILALSPISLLAQSTTVSATVVDSAGQTWTNGSISYQFQGNGTFQGKYQWNGADLPSQYLISQTIQLNSSGYGSFTVPSSTAIYPAGSSWKITICPNATYTCTTINVATTGTSEDISNLVTAALNPAPGIAIQQIPIAYSDAEVKAQPQIGGIYYNSLTGWIRFYDGAAFHNITTGISTFTFSALPSSVFGVTGGTCNTSGCTVTLNLANQTQGLVLASPASGTGTPGFRTLIAADIPTLAYVPLSRVFYYQTMERGGTTASPQEPTLNFSTNFNLTDTPGNFTNVDLVDIDTAGTCNTPTTLNYDTKGRITSCTSSGSTTPVAKTCNANGCYRINGDGTVEEWGDYLCATNSCTITFPYTFSTTTGLVLNVTPNWATDGNLTVVVNALTTSGATIRAIGVTPVGGGGTGYSGGATYMWRAIL